VESGNDTDDERLATDYWVTAPRILRRRVVYTRPITRRSTWPPAAAESSR
jgi:hypothetical protein